MQKSGKTNRKLDPISAEVQQQEQIIIVNNQNNLTYGLSEHTSDTGLQPNVHNFT